MENGVSSSGVPEVTARLPWSLRIRAIVIFGFLTAAGCISAVYGIVTGAGIGIMLFVTVGAALFAALLSYSVVPKVEFFDGHIRRRTMLYQVSSIGYADIIEARRMDSFISLQFRADRQLTVDRSQVDLALLSSFLESRGVKVKT